MTQRVNKAKPRRRFASFNRTRRGPGAKKAEARSKALAVKIKAIFDQYYRAIVDEEIKRVKGMVQKAAPNRERVIEQLATALTLSGIREVEDAGKRQDKDFKVAPSFYEQFYNEKKNTATAMLKNVDEEFKSNMRKFLKQWFTEDPGITGAELARRIRFSFYADGAEVLAPNQKPSRGILDPLERGPRITRDVFSRASLVARTEMGMAQNRGAFEVMRASGVKYKMWVSQQSDGGRGHQEMNGTVVPIDEDFILPDGTRMAAPSMGKVKRMGEGPIKHIANCRCTVVAAPRRKVREYERKNGINPSAEDRRRRK